MRKPSSWVSLVILLSSCEASAVQSAKPAGQRHTTSPGQESTPTKTSANDPPEKPNHIAWTNAIAWRTWDDALYTAKVENKPICVVVYADWCPRCQELALEFLKREMVEAAANMIMVRQDQDARPPWMAERLSKYGDYVPRIFFFNPNGEVREDLQSGHPRYPYFYAPMVTDVLLANMHKASGR